jgi:hypothetical protein
MGEDAKMGEGEFVARILLKTTFFIYCNKVILVRYKFKFISCLLCTCQFVGDHGGCQNF